MSKERYRRGAEMFGRKVDLRTPAELSRYFRDDVLEKARIEQLQSILKNKEW